MGFDEIEQMVKDSELFRLETAYDGDESWVCVTYDETELPHCNVNLTVPATDVEQAVANADWAVIRSESAHPSKRVRRVWFGP